MSITFDMEYDWVVSDEEHLNLHCKGVGSAMSLLVDIDFNEWERISYSNGAACYRIYRKVHNFIGTHEQIEEYLK